MKKVKIMILKTTFQKELAHKYGIEGLSTCPFHKEGQTYLADYAKPDGFCDEVWKAIYQYVFALSHWADKTTFYFNDWINPRSRNLLLQGWLKTGYI